jgi:cytochrome c553
VIRSLALVVGLCAALAPALARAQTNLDEGKSAAQIFAGACVECHKSPHGLGKGKSVSAIADFLGEHYTTNHAQAAALAAYVLGGRGAEPVGGAAQGRGQKPTAERDSASTEEPKPSKRQPKQAARPEPDEGKPANARLRRTREEVKPKEEASPKEPPNIAEPESAPQGDRAATATRSRPNEPKMPEPVQEPAAVAHVPPVTTPTPPEATPNQEAPSGAAAPTAAAPPADAAPGDGAPVERDHIPD